CARGGSNYYFDYW
nr:immunoglobulin heavy chain junction region [Mus musculus]MBK4188132.1 immunoglobulin heavy chain junction region [Mus musculus]MBK4188133.1 immunoglobulin heavy chain junction region [Mus musculus]MBK4188134.1 immunoglobulin heavy chain junction region [Mus musculus]